MIQVLTIMPFVGMVRSGEGKRSRFDIVTKQKQLEILEGK